MIETDKIHHGKNIDVLRTLPPNSVDSVVTDPPYGINFMNKKWDYDVPSVETWREVLRVMKPGAFALVACGTRTQHRMAVNLEDAGFEIHDIVAWIYGQGFPKSLDISKAIDATLLKGSSHSTALRGVEQDGGGEAYTLKGRNNGIMGDDRTYERKEFTPSTAFAKQWQGWGTALKPAMELWTLCQKPREGTYAGNVLKYGCGGLNIDGCRVGTEERLLEPATPSKGTFNNSFDSDYNGKTVNGRFPANVIHDGSEEVVKGFPTTSSGLMGANNTRHTDGSPNGIYGKFDKNAPLAETYGDSGSAAVAAKLEEMRYIGIEREAEYVKIAEARVENCDRDYKTIEETLKQDGVVEVPTIFDFIGRD